MYSEREDEERDEILWWYSKLGLMERGFVSVKRGCCVTGQSCNKEIWLSLGEYDKNNSMIVLQNSIRAR